MFAYLVYNTYSFFIVNRKGLNSLKSWLILNFQLMRWTVLIAQACLSKNFQFCVYRWGAKTELWTWWGGIHPLPPCGRGALPLLTQDGEGYKWQVLGWQQAQPHLNYCVAYAKTITCIFSSWILLGKNFWGVTLPAWCCGDHRNLEKNGILSFIQELTKVEELSGLSA